jgi:hypothetical protein
MLSAWPRPALESRVAHDERKPEAAAPPQRDAAPADSVEVPVGSAPTMMFGSDAISEALRALDIPYIALTPGASFRGLHDSIVNYLGNTKPRILLCLHEEHAVAIAHGYAKVTGGRWPPPRTRTSGCSTPRWRCSMRGAIGCRSC